MILAERGMVSGGRVVGLKEELNGGDGRGGKGKMGYGGESKASARGKREGHI